MIKGKVLTILAALLGVTAACSLGVAAYIIIQPGTSSENGVAETEMSNAGVIQDNNNEGDDLAGDHDGLPEVGIDQDVDWGTETETTAEAAESEADEVEQTDGVDESDVDEFVENPGVHNGYLHEVGGARFYTEHDLRQWLRPDEDHPQYLSFDIRQMIIDLTGCNVIYHNEACAGANYAVWLDNLDTSYTGVYHTVHIENARDRRISITMNNCPPPNVKDYYLVMENYIYGIHRDLAAILLYTVEQIVANPEYDAADLNLSEDF